MDQNGPYDLKENQFTMGMAMYTENFSCDEDNNCGLDHKSFEISELFDLKFSQYHWTDADIALTDIPQITCSKPDGTIPKQW